MHGAQSKLNTHDMLESMMKKAGLSRRQQKEISSHVKQHGSVPTSVSRSKLPAPPSKEEIRAEQEHQYTLLRSLQARKKLKSEIERDWILTEEDRGIIRTQRKDLSKEKEKYIRKLEATSHGKSTASMISKGRIDSNPGTLDDTTYELILSTDKSSAPMMKRALVPGKRTGDDKQMSMAVTNGMKREYPSRRMAEDGDDIYSLTSGYMDSEMGQIPESFSSYIDKLKFELEDRAKYLIEMKKMDAISPLEEKQLNSEMKSLARQIVKERKKKG
ncbi:hypothetical protein ADUPG1_013725 [Aduncisulcus paluster]|uniref:Uncharacterized protein n=1 Tax=Aduncisulcus paluster TaxID=2918883 RepID=A0ABQ5K3X0_9EUKA|nr:hypothetical protein ADUPG1_013725 [Aduncisulcus paluster]